MISRLDRFADALYGYDVFISYRHKDGQAYARALGRALEAKGYSCFVDYRDYKLGEPLAEATRRHCRKATVFVLLCTPAILEHRDPDWVKLEIEAFLSAKTDTDAKLIPIGFDGLLSSADAAAKIQSLLGRPFIWQVEATTPEEGSPTPSIVEAVTETIGGQRRDIRRKRFFRGLSIVLLVLLLMSSGLGVGVAVALRQSEANLQAARKNLAQVYMEEARRRLARFDVNGANAFAAAALTQEDRSDARRLIVEHPLFEGRDVTSAELAGFVSIADSDAANDRFVFAQDGRLWSVDPSGHAMDIGQTDLSDIYAIDVSPDGSRIAIVRESGAVLLAPLSTPRESCKVGLPELADRGYELLWLEPDRLLAAGGDGLYLIGTAADCQGLTVSKVPDGDPCGNLAMDRVGNHVFMSCGPVRRYSWSNGSLKRDREFAMPTSIGGDAPMQPTSLTWMPALRSLVVTALGQPELILLDPDLRDARDFGLSGFADEHGNFYVRAARSNATGDRLYIADQDGGLLMLDAAPSGGPPFRIVARMDAGIGVDVERETIAASGMTSGGVRLLAIDPPDRRRVLSRDYNDGAEHRSWPIALSPDGATLAINGGGDLVQMLDTASGRLQSFRSGIEALSWLGFDASGKHLAILGEQGLGIFTLDGKVGRLESGLSRFSETGFSDAAWLSDGSAIALLSPWHGIITVPVAPDQPAELVPDTQMLHADRLLSLPGNRLAFLAGQGMRILTLQPARITIDVPIKDNLFIGDLAVSSSGEIALATRLGVRWMNLAGAGELEPQPPAGSPGGDKIRITRDGGRLALVERNDVLIMQRGQQQILAKIPFENSDVWDAALSPDGSHIYVADYDGSLYSVSLAALDEDAAALAARIGAKVGFGQPDLTIAAKAAH